MEKLHDDRWQVERGASEYATARIDTRANEILISAEADVSQLSGPRGVAAYRSRYHACRSHRGRSLTQADTGREAVTGTGRRT
jgi:hypothetical protein